jgi:hypothetical protein
MDGGKAAFDFSGIVITDPFMENLQALDVPGNVGNRMRHGFVQPPALAMVP